MSASLLGPPARRTRSQTAAEERQSTLVYGAEAHTASAAAADVGRRARFSVTLQPLGQQQSIALPHGDLVLGRNPVTQYVRGCDAAAAGERRRSKGEPEAGAVRWRRRQGGV